jgi:hypothetical protein
MLRTDLLSIESGMARPDYFLCAIKEGIVAGRLERALRLSSHPTGVVPVHRCRSGFQIHRA